MNPRHLFTDDRLAGVCVYCGGAGESRDHVPSKVLLDEPYPPHLPVVDACTKCNGGFSLDEEYFACFLECVIAGSTNPEVVSRPKIRQILSRKPMLADEIDGARRVANGLTTWMPKEERVRNVVLKLARGHCAYEFGSPILDEPNEIEIIPFELMPLESRQEFENAEIGEISGWPEIGSRAFLRASGAHPNADQLGPWIIVQPKRYRYLVEECGTATVRIAVSEYLACKVHWA